MGVFNALSWAVNGGQKVFKYKQQKMIDSIEGLVDPEDYQMGKSGICATLTMRWLPQRLGRTVSTTDNGFGFGRSDSEERILADMETTAQNIAIYRALKEMAAAIDKAEAVREIGKKYGLDFDINSTSKATDFDPFDVIMADCLNECDVFDNAYYIAFSVHEAGGNPVGVHAVGLMRKDGELLFFDPNIGEYSLFDPTKFFETYKACYADDALNWNLATSRAYAFWVKH